ncbi:hypothetical protein A6R68_17623, partial [Neotoma lepida]
MAFNGDGSGRAGKAPLPALAKSSLVDGGLRKLGYAKEEEDEMYNPAFFYENLKIPSERSRAEFADCRGIETRSREEEWEGTWVEKNEDEDE